MRRVSFVRFFCRREHLSQSYPDFGERGYQTFGHEQYEPALAGYFQGDCCGSPGRSGQSCCHSQLTEEIFDVSFICLRRYRFFGITF